MNGYNAFSGALDPEHICKYFDAVVKKERINLPVQNSVHLNVVSETFVCCEICRLTEIIPGLICFTVSNWNLDIYQKLAFMTAEQENVLTFV